MSYTGGRGLTEASMSQRYDGMIARRLYRLIGPDAAALPAAGGDVDLVADAARPDEVSPGIPAVKCFPAILGNPFQVEAGAAFSIGANLQTDSSGRVVPAGTGKVIARALEGSSGAGAVVWIVFVSGR